MNKCIWMNTFDKWSISFNHKIRYKVNNLKIIEEVKRGMCRLSFHNTSCFQNSWQFNHSINQMTSHFGAKLTTFRVLCPNYKRSFAFRNDEGPIRIFDLVVSNWTGLWKNFHPTLYFYLSSASSFKVREIFLRNIIINRQKNTKNKLPFGRSKSKSFIHIALWAVYFEKVVWNFSPDAESKIRQNEEVGAPL